MSILLVENNKEEILIVSQVSVNDDDCACPDSTSKIIISDSFNTTDNDCACPDSQTSLYVKDNESPIYSIVSDVTITPLTNKYYLAFSPLAPQGPCVLNSLAVGRLQSFNEPQPLGMPIDEDFVSQYLIVPHDKHLTIETSEPTTLTVWIHITNACNLECPYCYVRKSSDRMDDATGLNSVKRVFELAVQRNFKQVKLKYAGGEATLHWKLVRKLHEYASLLAQSTGIQLREVLLSNGVVIRPEFTTWLRDSGIKLMLSIDGIGKTHDSQRPRKGSGPTFAAIEHNLDNILLPNNIRPDVTITITKNNANGAADVVRWVLERNLPVSLNFYRQNILSDLHSDLELEETVIIDGMKAAYKVFEEFLPESSFFNGLLDRVQGEAHTHTCGVGIAYLVITHEGKLAQCQMHLENPVSNSFDDNALQLVSKGAIKNLSVDDKEGCKTCIYRYRCSGGCPLETYRATGRWDIKSPHCKIYKTLLPEALRLEGLRLLKTNGLLS